MLRRLWPIGLLLLSSLSPAQRAFLRLTSIPAFGSSDDLTGVIVGLDPEAYAVATFIYVDDLGWYSKPTCSQTLVQTADGSFRIDITTGGIDEQATMISVYAVPRSFEQPCLRGAAGIPQATRDAALTSITIERPDPQRKELEFSGYRFLVRSSLGPVSPGPNVFSEEGVFVDARGKLHLRIEKKGNSWRSAEVLLSETLGYGTFRFFIDSTIDEMDPNVVAGMFTYSPDPDFAHRELDVEISRWKTPGGQNAQFVVQPFSDSANIFRFFIPPGFAGTAHRFTWSPLSAVFRTDVTGGTLHEWTRTGSAVPPSLNERVHLNLWLNDGEPPSDGKDFEVVFSRFEFDPLPSQQQPRIAAVVNAASNQPNLSPGVIATIYGENLAKNTDVANTIPLSARIADTTVWIGGRQAPLFYVSPGQINFQVPYDVRSGERQVAAVLRGGFRGTSSVQVDRAGPGIFMREADSSCIAQNQDGTINSAESRATPGSVLVLYVSGIGTLDHPVFDGMAAAAAPLSRATLPAKASIAGNEMRILYLGLTPESVGLGQANVEVPSLGPGRYSVSMEISDRLSNTCQVWVR